MEMRLQIMQLLGEVQDAKTEIELRFGSISKNGRTDLLFLVIFSSLLMLFTLLHPLLS